MTLKIAGKTIHTSEIEAKNHQAREEALSLINEPKMSDKKKFLSLIEDNLLLLIQHNITAKKIEDWIWYIYLVDIKKSYLYVHLRELKVKYNLIK